MPTDTEQLVVSLEARIRDFERNFQRANRTSSQNFQAIERQAKRSADTLEQTMSKASQGVNVALAGLKGGVAGIVAGLSIGALQGVVSRIGDITKGIANIGSEAKRAGLSTRAFQELGYVAQQNRIPLDALTDGMKELSLRADEFIVTGQGSAAEAFARLGYGATDLKRKLQDPSALLVEIIGKLQQLDKAAQIRIADELFGGTGGERFVELIDRGADGMRKLIKEANDFGAVMDDEVIARADELDRKWSALGSTITTWTKQAVLGLVGAMDDVLDRFNKIDEQSTRNVQSALTDIYSKLQAEKQNLADLMQVSVGTPADVMNINQSQKEIQRLTDEAMKLREILDRRQGYSESFIYKAGQEAKDATPELSNLYGALNSTGTAAGTGAKGLNSFAEAVRALKNEIPDLANNLAQLDAQARINTAYNAALSKARTMGEVYQANELRGAALKAVNVKSATDDPAKYLSNVLASGKNQQHISGMQSSFQQKLATMIASMPDDLKGSVTVNSGYRSPERQQQLWFEALKKYGSPEAARKWVAPPGNSQHNKGNAADLGYTSDAARQWVHQNAGNYGLSFPMKHEPWHIEDETARSTARATEIEQQTTALIAQSDAYKSIVADARSFTAEQQTEQQALTMSGQAAQAYRYEQQMLADAMRQGIPLTAQQRQEIAQLAQGMATAEAATQQYALTQEQAQQVSGFFASTAADALTGLITGTMTAEQALQRLIASLAQAVLQAALLGQGPLASLMGGGGKSGGGLLGAIFGGIFGAKNGGFITPKGVQHFASGGNVRGPGTSRSDSIPAYLSDGEFVVNADATRKNRAVLEAINSGKAPRIAGMNVGGRGGATRSVNNISNVFSPTIPITVQASGNKEADQAMAERLSDEMDTLLENKMTEFVQKQQRPGAMIGGHQRKFT
ncbi:D-alanyl-D-alanine carboxypeptidase family protein [Rhizobium pusense]|uniref:D-alanyl-D-alanine carboxypeptidase family protein n=1 Tax=Agrobacterium pusense TaxID=648995 RepID=UPI00244BAAF3|nr:D-alanyl-D-alanine carboxypeptidase family protein [Agrobacterium pusense]MDH0113375.1 D-alanyl-D-alanine carboxypeptidase family protein [Agrobacterium pusense]